MHTKEPWGQMFEEATEHPLVVGYVACAVDPTPEAPANKIKPIAVFRKAEDLARAFACVNACAGLPEPEKNIKELVEAVKALFDAMKSRSVTATEYEALKKALAPFEEK